MDIVIVTGLSGSGKSRAINHLEDIGFFCVDNLPAKLIPQFFEIKKDSKKGIGKIAIVTDTRGGEMFFSLFRELEKLKSVGINYKILFLDADDETLKKRFNETRRKHPLIGTNNCFSLEKAIKKERKILEKVKSKADFVVDTSILNNNQLKEKMCEIFLKEKKNAMIVEIVSFGFKYGDIKRSDLVFDVRCLPNPYYVERLKAKTGLDKEIKDYIMSFTQTVKLLKKLEDLIFFLMTLYLKEGKSQLTIAFGCSGGAHRSVVFAEYFYKKFKEQKQKVSVNHRDIKKYLG